MFDVVVIGGGVAGWTAARRSQQLGARVIVLEKSAVGPGYSNGVLSSGTIHAAYLNPRTASPDALFAQILRKTEGHARPDVARAWADNVGRAVDFLQSEGAEFRTLGGADYQQTSLAPGLPPPPAGADYWQDGGADRLLSRMCRSFVDGGGTFRPGVRARQLAVQNGTVDGVVIESTPSADRAPELIHGRTAIMADGGFQGNPDLMARYVTPHPNRYQNIGSENDTGDCLEMALAVGAGVVEMDAFYGNIGFRDALRNEHLRFRRAPSPMPLVNAALVVNGNGERIGDEALGPDEWSSIEPELSIPVLRTQAAGDSWVVFDHEIWETVGRGQLPDGAPGKRPGVLNPLLQELGGTLATGESVESLARDMGVPIERLQASVAAFNSFCVDGTPLDPPRTRRAQPLRQAPFHAIPLIAGIFYTMGGVLVNGGFQVLDEQEHPIPGLFATGGTMGGLDGGPRNGYAGGWSGALTSGLVAAETAVAQLRAGAGRGTSVTPAPRS